VVVADCLAATVAVAGSPVAVVVVAVAVAVAVVPAVEMVVRNFVRADHNLAVAAAHSFAAVVAEVAHSFVWVVDTLAGVVADSFVDFHNFDFADFPSVAFCWGQALLQKL